MAWTRYAGITGVVYTPEKRCGGKQFRCKDCFSCQQCSPQRCSVCINLENAGANDQGQVPSIGTARRPVTRAPKSQE